MKSNIISKDETTQGSTTCHQHDDRLGPRRDTDDGRIEVLGQLNVDGTVATVAAAERVVGTDDGALKFSFLVSFHLNAVGHDDSLRMKVCVSFGFFWFLFFFYA